ncbi:MAG: Lipoprotein [Frankiales bacterium]|nr:Lipoprotein [Frankiales bacterium]
MRAWRAFYGSSPLHVLAVLFCLAVSGYAVLQVAHGSQALKIGLWFLGAVVAHDFLLYPLYTAADRAVGGVLHGGSVNWVRVPALLSGLLLLVFWPVITRHSKGSYGFASGLDQSVFLGRYLAVVAVLFATSALLFAVSRLRSRTP